MELLSRYSASSRAQHGKRYLYPEDFNGIVNGQENVDVCKDNV